MSVYQDQHIVVDPSSDDVQDHSIIVTITAFDADVIIEAGTDKEIEKYNYRGIGSLRIPIVDTTTLWIYLRSGINYKFEYTINNLLVKDGTPFDIRQNENGLQFLSEQYDEFTPFKINNNSFFKIDNNKYFRR